MFNIIKKSYLWVAIAIFGVVAGFFTFVSNMRLSIQFTGGLEFTLPEIQKDKEVVKSQLSTFLDDYRYQSEDASGAVSKIESYEVFVSTEDEVTNLLIKTPIQDDKMVKGLSDGMQQLFVDKGYVASSDQILKTSIIGPSIGTYMKKTAGKALILGIIFMGIYILFAFSGLRDMVNPVLLAVITAFTLLFDVAIPAGAYGIMMSLNPSLQVDTISVIALLTIMGYSVNDTIVIFDRIRENYKNSEGSIRSGKKSYGELFETSLWQTMRRSIGTSLSTLIVVVSMYLLGTGMLQTFSFILMIGVVAGTYSSIFVAAPLTYILTGKYNSEK